MVFGVLSADIPLRLFPEKVNVRPTPQPHRPRKLCCAPLLAAMTRVGVKRMGGGAGLGLGIGDGRRHACMNATPSSRRRAALGWHLCLRRVKAPPHPNMPHLCPFTDQELLYLLLWPSLPPTAF